MNMKVRPQPFPLH